MAQRKATTRRSRKKAAGTQSRAEARDAAAACDYRLRIGYAPHNEDEVHIIDSNNQPRTFALMSSVQQHNLLVTLRPLIIQPFSLTDPAGPYIDRWDCLALQTGESFDTPAGIEAVIRARLQEAAGVDHVGGQPFPKFDIQSGVVFTAVEYVHYNNRVLCEHYFQLNKGDGMGGYMPWTFNNVGFHPDGNAGTPQWHVTVDYIFVALRFEAIDPPEALTANQDIARGS